MSEILVLCENELVCSRPDYRTEHTRNSVFRLDTAQMLSPLIYIKL